MADESSSAPPATTRCKVYCAKTDEATLQDAAAKPVNGAYPTVEGQTAQFYAVASTDVNSENGRFFLATPSLQLTVAVARGRPFEVGKSYYLDFTESST